MGLVAAELEEGSGVLAGQFCAWSGVCGHDPLTLATMVAKRTMLVRVVIIYHNCIARPRDHVVNLLRTLRLLDLEDKLLLVEVEERVQGVGVPVVEDCGDDVGEVVGLACGWLGAVDQVRMAGWRVGRQLGAGVHVGWWW